MMTRTRRLALSTAVAWSVVFAAACATSGLKLKQQIVSYHDGVQTTLDALVQFERQAYANNAIPQLRQPASPGFVAACPTSKVELRANPENHHVLNCLFAVAAIQSQSASTAIQAWHSGDPLPTDVATLQADVTQILTVSRSLLPAGAAEYLAKAQAVADAVLQLVTTIQSVRK